MSILNGRVPITKVFMDDALEDVSLWLVSQVAAKGAGAFSSLHEMRGAISEEYDELMEALHQKDLGQIEHELKDLAAAVIFGLACLQCRAFGRKALKIEA
jgi:NTP pyrophosphatase (non-canonical NTP hydrolase)